MIYFEIDESGSCSNIFSISQIGTRSIHLLEFPDCCQASPSAVAVRVSRLCLAFPHTLTVQYLEEFLASNPFSLRATIKNCLTSNKERQPSSRKRLSVRKIGEATVQDQLIAKVLVKAMTEETKAAKHFYRTDNVVQTPDWMKAYLEKAHEDYAARPQKRRPKISDVISSKIVKFVS